MGYEYMVGFLRETSTKEEDEDEQHPAVVQRFLRTMSGWLIRTQ